ncbi:MAG TPA: hypothetical protein VEI97_13625, partial [bacterium]|nr:hypothetical protein [bacterium]
TRSPVQPAEVLALVERWKDLAGRVVAGRTWEEIFRQSLFTPACGLGTLTPGEAEQVVMDLRAFGAAVRQVQMC